MNSSTPEPQSGAIDFKDFTKRRMLHVVLPLFIVSIIAFLDRVNIAYAGLTMKENLPWLTPEVFGMGSRMYSYDDDDYRVGVLYLSILTRSM